MIHFFYLLRSAANIEKCKQKYALILFFTGELHANPVYKPNQSV